MTKTIHSHIMTFHKRLETIEGVRGGPMVLLYGDGRYDLLPPEDHEPADYVRAVEEFEMDAFEPERDDDEPEGLWLLIDELTGHA